MSRYSKEEWERRKTYLIRSLFEDLPILSPINESQEPSSPSDSNIYRPESPLPDLIIEKEPSKHQESEDEEFYEKLAREMRRRYKKDFLNRETSSSVDNNTEIADENTQADSFDVESGSLGAEKSVQEENEEEYNSEIGIEEHQVESSPPSTSTESSDTEETCRYEQIKTIADIHAEVDSSFKSSLKAIHRREEDEISRSKSTEVEELSFPSEEKEGCHDSGHEAEIRHSGSQELAILTEVSPESHYPKSSDEYNRTPEIIRRRHTIFSEDSLPLHELPVRESNDIVISKGVSMEIDDTVISDNITHFEIDIADASNPDSNIQYTATSTPKSSKTTRSSVIKKYSNRLVPYTPSSRGSKDLTCAVALQTSFSSDHEPEWKDIWSNFFIGTPTVYNVCSCKDHVCT